MKRVVVSLAIAGGISTSNGMKMNRFTSNGKGKGKAVVVSVDGQDPSQHLLPAEPQPEPPLPSYEPPLPSYEAAMSSDYGPPSASTESRLAERDHRVDEHQEKLWERAVSGEKTDVDGKKEDEKEDVGSSSSGAASSSSSSAPGNFRNEMMSRLYNFITRNLSNVHSARGTVTELIDNKLRLRFTRTPGLLRGLVNRLRPRTMNPLARALIEPIVVSGTAVASGDDSVPMVEGVQVTDTKDSSYEITIDSNISNERLKKFIETALTGEYQVQGETDGRMQQIILTNLIYIKLGKTDNVSLEVMGRPWMKRRSCRKDPTTANKEINDLLAKITFTDEQKEMIEILRFWGYDVFQIIKQQAFDEVSQIDRLKEKSSRITLDVGDFHGVQIELLDKTFSINSPAVRDIKEIYHAESDIIDILDKYGFKAESIANIIQGLV